MARFQQNLIYGHWNLNLLLNLAFHVLWNILFYFYLPLKFKKHSKVWCSIKTGSMQDLAWELLVANSWSKISECYSNGQRYFSRSLWVFYIYLIFGRERKPVSCFYYKHWCCSHTFWETNSLRRTMQIAECSLLHRRAQGRVSAKDPDQFLWKPYIP